MLILIAVIALAALALALLVVVATVYRVFRNVGPLDLEDYARRNHVIYIPVTEQLVKELQADWSKPVKLRLNNHRHPLLAELLVQPVSGE
jgi:hypothetical protein